MRTSASMQMMARGYPHTPHLTVPDTLSPGACSFLLMPTRPGVCIWRAPAIDMGRFYMKNLNLVLIYRGMIQKAI